MTQSERLADLRTRLFGGHTAGASPDRVTEADRVLLLEMEQVAKRLEQGEGFSITPIVSHTTGKGLLDVSWMGQVAQIEPVQARELGWVFLEAAAIVEAEAALCRFLREWAGLNPEDLAMALHDFRRHRDEGSSLVGHPTN